MQPTFDLQGHRGARGLKPENTLSSFEAALDAGVSSIETDLHLTGDDEVVLCHDPILSPAIFGPLDSTPAVRRLTLRELRRYRAMGNPDPARFPTQDNEPTPLAMLYAQKHGFDPWAVPTLLDLFRFAEDYAGTDGERVGKSVPQRRQASQVRFDLELKRVPFFPESIGDGFTGHSPGLLEQQIAEIVRAAKMVERTMVRSFDHRSVLMMRRLEPGLTGAVLAAHTAFVSPDELLRRADAQVYCPDYFFLDEDQVRRVHEADGRVIPWTVNDRAHQERLLAWRVDGMTTDYPDRLALLLKERG
jgi:glycerophosphoryl diester phosphodiesterase